MSAELFARLRAGLVTAGAEETQTLAAELLPALPVDSVLALHGDLGTGKTTFTQGLARALGVRERVTSPTFTLFNLHRGERLLLHFDAYRLETEAAVDVLMIEEFLASPFLMVVEWPDKVGSWLHSLDLPIIALRFSTEPGGQHRVVLLDQAS